MYTVIARVIAAVLVFLQQVYYWNGSSDDIGDPLALQDMKITGLILARMGSKGLPGKNMIDLNGHPLIHWSLKTMMDSGVFDELWVSTDDPTTKKYALSIGAKVHDRAAYTATDDASSVTAVQEFLEKHPSVQNVGLIQCTSPFVTSQYLIEAAERFKSGKCDSVFSVTRSHQLRWSADVDGNFAAKPINFDPQWRPRRQSWQGEFVENGMFYFFRQTVAKRGAVQGNKPCVVEVLKKHSLEVDTEEDLKIARVLWESRSKEANDNRRTEL